MEPNNPLFDLLLQRQLGAPEQAPVVPPSGGSSRVPQQAKRFANALQIQDAYKNGWNPNPVLLRASLGNR